MSTTRAPARRRAGGCSRSPASTGVGLGATGTHALSDYREQHIIDTEHYRRVEEGLKYVAWRNNTFSVHVHVGVRGADRAVRVCDRLRPVLPLLLATQRQLALHRRARLRPALRAQPDVHEVVPALRHPRRVRLVAAWAEYVELLVRTGSIVEFTQLWWSVRPHHDFGTVEVRICDAQMTAGESDGLTELIVACVRRAAAEIDAGETRPTCPRG